MLSSNLSFLANRFAVKGDIISIAPFGEGHINTTYLVKTNDEQYILQKINDSIFKDVDMLMNNIQQVTSFIRSKGKETINIIPTKDGKLFVKTEDGYFRMMEFAKNTICYQKVDGNLKLVESEGAAFGELHHLLNDIPVEQIKETIPNFHNTYKRYLDFVDALQKAPKDRIANAQAEFDFINEHKNDYSRIYDEIEKGGIRTRIIHNDTKINNVLFDKDSGLYRLIIDLDTMMPGSVLFDIGDAFRGLFSGDNEDNRDTSLLKVDVPVFKAFIKAYLNKMKNELTKTEIELIPFSIYLMTIECGIRFLEDYLRGNVYFHIQYEEHNLVRAKTQIALAKDVLGKMDDLNKIVDEILEE